MRKRLKKGKSSSSKEDCFFFTVKSLKGLGPVSQASFRKHVPNELFFCLKLSVVDLLSCHDQKFVLTLLVLLCNKLFKLGGTNSNFYV